ncbi:hypothetical protein GPECTOR_25g359 [Gonium pectorale]|uniref:Isopenicillin N synthase-like Fe(2+) 2OG dioxygenase domain-containing protein n=1 Tax=Gonium pectorale TaxID=33097 RepID=A0A150GGM6_GONPE|nr:hypothetical protein GPECTOR_25g359 [Gonium pectorale]|eukprot:KXZ48775.1 hypothetical protein GPECTOR_25g359 [Gonium pectorale]
MESRFQSDFAGFYRFGDVHGGYSSPYHIGTTNADMLSAWSLTSPDRITAVSTCCCDAAIIDAYAALPSLEPPALGELRIHSGQLGLLLEDDPQLQGQASASVLRTSCSPEGATAAGSRGRPWRGGGEWADVPLGPGRVAVLVGFSLSYALGGLVRPALHRVAPGGPRRVSLAYELCFRPGARIDPAEGLRKSATAPEG